MQLIATILHHINMKEKIMKPKYLPHTLNIKTLKREALQRNAFNVMSTIFTLIGILLSLAGFSQQDDISFSPINDGTTFETCNGFIIDSGGQGGTGYSNNENFTITVCPDTITEGDNTLYITTTFNLFDLDETNTGTQQNPNLDFMAVYDGPDASYPTLGSYNTDGLQNVSIAATSNNGSGCLTFVFYSNSTGTGQFSASATCTQPCVPPIADAFIVNGATPDSIALCIGEEVTFDGSASTASDGFNIAEYSWNFIDGTIDNTTGPLITHSFDAPGYYDVQLTITDDNPDNTCQNLNVVPLKVFVSNYPTYYDFPGDMTICLGDTINLTGITPGVDGFGQYDSTWTGFPASNLIDDGCLADTLLGISQSIPITYTEFDPSATLESVDDIVSICLNMEHSFMGDLIVQLSCPDGTTINLQEQEGGGTQIGEPDPADNVDCINGTGIGVGYDYCWDNDATETWLEWVDNNDPDDNTLAPGTYQSADPLSDLIGCPLQGTWQITVIDNWAADDGTIFEFGVTFAPEFYPDIIEFTNTIGEGADSSFWDLGDANILENTSDLNQITISPDELGLYEYNYFVVNNFGCEFDSTITVNVIDGPEITAGPDLTYCVDPIQIQADVANADPSEIVWSWSPSTGLSDANIQNPSVEVSQATVYTLSAYFLDFPGCIATDQVVISPDAEADPGIDTDSTLCFNSPTSILTDYLNGSPAPGGIWTDIDGEEVDNSFNPTQFPEGTNLNLTYTVNNGTCENSSNLILTVLPATNPMCCQTNAFAGSDDVACALTYDLQAETPVGTGEWTGPPEVSFSDINDPNATATCTSPGGSMTLTWTDYNGFQCSASDEITIQFSDSLNVLAVTENTICYNECTGSAVAIASGGTAPNNSYTFDWGESGVAGIVPSLRDSICTGTFMLKLTDNFGCTDSTVFSIGQPPSQEIFITQSPPLCADSCNGEIIIDSPGAVEYSFDAGNSFKPINKATVCAGVYPVIARNENGCEIGETVTLNDPQPYSANFNINPNPTTTKNTRITFQDVSRPGPVAKSEYTFGMNPVLGEGDSRISIFTFPNDTAGTYPITLISTNQNGCVDSLTKLLTIDPELQWYVPNSFSPNEDGINDIWKPIGETHDLNDFRLSIFNRWGEQMFFTTDYSKGWNGTDSGSGYYVDAGVYSYLIKFSSRTTEEKYEITGHITVIR